MIIHIVVYGYDDSFGEISQCRYQFAIRAYVAVVVAYLEHGVLLGERKQTQSVKVGRSPHDVRIDQLLDEFEKVIDIILYIFRTLKFDNYTAQISLRDPNNKEKYIGSDENWEKAESAIMQAAKEKGLTTVVELGEAAFYGPKLEFTLKDSLGRDWQCGTIQVDFNLPQRLGAEYVGKDNQKHVPVMLHRAALGSIERFLGILIEEYMGDFPLWLAPVQARVLPISEKFVDYAKQVERELVDAGVRVEIDDSNEKLGYKIRQCELQKVPYKLIVGEKEATGKLISVNKRKEGDKGQMTVQAFIDMTADDRKVVR